MNDKKLKILLGVLLFIIAFIAVFFIVGIAVLIPDAIVSIFGAPDPALDNSSRILYSVKLYLNMETLNIPFSNSGSNSIFVISPGKTANEVVEDLANAQLVKDPGTFTNYLVYKGIDRHLQAGTYVLNPILTPIEIAELLYDTTPEDISFSFLAGWRAEEIAALLPTSGINISSEEFMDLITNPPPNFNRDHFTRSEIT